MAIKLLRPDLLDGEGLIAEAQVMARLQHPNIVAVHDAGIASDQLFVCMKYAADPELPSDGAIGESLLHPDGGLSLRRIRERVLPDERRACLVRIDCCEMNYDGTCVAICGNGACEAGEYHASCDTDCCEMNPDGTCAPVCGNGICEAGETQCADCSSPAIPQRR